MDASEHPAVEALAVIVMAVMASVVGFVWWYSDRKAQEADAWDIVTVGARCAAPGVEERTFGDRPVYCAPFPSYGTHVWSLSRADVADPARGLAPVDEREARIRVCMEQLELSRENCEAGLRQHDAIEG